MRVPHDLVAPLLALPDPELRAEIRALDKQVRRALRMLVEGRRELRRRARNRRKPGGLPPG